MRTVRLLAAAALCLGVLVAAGPAAGRVKLTTLPVRERVEIQLDNPAATLVEEERIVTLLPGENQIDFSWSGVPVEKDTIQFRVVDMPTRPAGEGDPSSIVRPDGSVERIRLLGVSYPPGENALVWQVYSEEAVAARVRISYVMRRVSRTFSYRALVSNDESEMALRNYIRLENLSGEEFGLSGVWAGFGKYFRREVGLNQAREMLAWKFDAVPVEKTYTFDWYEGTHVPGEPEQRYVEMRYVLRNDPEHGLGEFPLQPGKVRIFQRDSRGGEAFLGEDWGGLTPVGGKEELYLGLARDVVVSRRIAESRKIPVRGNLYHREVTLEYEIENFKSDPVTLTLREDLGRLRDELAGGKDHAPEWRLDPRETTLAEDAFEREDASTLLFRVPLEAAPEGGEVEKRTVRVRIELRNEW